MWDFGEDNRGPEMAIVSIVVTSLTVIAVSLRCYTMVAILKRFMIEDWLAVITCLFQVAFCAFVLLGVSHGLGAHVDNVPLDERPKALVWKWAGQIAYIVVSTMVKFVVGIFLLRLCVESGWQRITIWVLLVLVGVFNAFYVFIAIFQCQPVAFYWWRYTTNPPVIGKCNGHTLATVPTYIAVLLGIAGDLILALLPITLIKKAKLDRKTKISVVCVLSLGSLASVATIARIPYAQQLLSNPDYLASFADLAIWSIVECGIAITASSLATLRPLFVKLSILASNHFSTQFTSIKVGGPVLPMFSNHNTTTSISASRRNKAQDNKSNNDNTQNNNNRNTAMTAMTGTTAASGSHGWTSLRDKTDGIQVEKQFEMSVMTREPSEDSMDQLKAEANEVVYPGTAKLSARRDRQHYGSLRSSPRSSIAPVQTSLWDAQTIVPSTTSAGSSISSINGAWPLDTSGYHKTATQSPRSVRSTRKFRQSQRQTQNSMATTFGGVGLAHTDDATRQTPQPPRLRHTSTSSADSGLSNPGTPLSPAPSFHFPNRRQHQSIASTASGTSRASTLAPDRSRGTFGGRQFSNGDYVSGVNADFTSSPTTSGNPQMTPTLGSPASSNARFPYHKQEMMREARDERRRKRSSAFTAGGSSTLNLELGDGTDQELAGPQQPLLDGEAPTPLSPLRSHPPLSPRGNWL
ncbi:hypothetical protein VM1G_06533 [Cytospora mali]|uniref:Rhodopsin domain-containing protein n=1 Tax=Cytospora mali TaxID=578113 RepID=A0A194W1G4_CYTMA|nr:hypothetical protein VM1G_06533 [Valsa mali]